MAGGVGENIYAAGAELEAAPAMSAVRLDPPAWDAPSRWDAFGHWSICYFVGVRRQFVLTAKRVSISTETSAHDF